MALISYLYVATAFFVADPLYVCGALIGVAALALLAVHARDRARGRRRPAGPPVPVRIPRQRSGEQPQAHGSSGHASGAS